MAGPTASHALQKAGINHIVLKRSKARAACRPGERFVTRGPDRKVWIDSKFFGNVRNKYVMLLYRLTRISIGIVS